MDDVFVADNLRDDYTQPRSIEVPFRLSMDARDLFPDLNISQTDINWFREVDGELTQIDDSHRIELRIDDPGRQSIYYEIPAISQDYKYAFPYWAVESSIVGCNIDVSSIVDDRYRFRVRYDGSIEPDKQRFIVQNEIT